MKKKAIHQAMNLLLNLAVNKHQTAKGSNKRSWNSVVKRLSK